MILLAGKFGDSADAVDASFSYRVRPGGRGTLPGSAHVAAEMYKVKSVRKVPGNVGNLLGVNELN